MKLIVIIIIVLLLGITSYIAYQELKPAKINYENGKIDGGSITLLSSKVIVQIENKGD